MGRYLRRFSIDELPQLLNIFKGEMSLVDRGRCRRAGRREPGAAGLAPRGAGRHDRLVQINGRSEATPEEAMHLDQFYIENWSLTLDLYIVLKTSGRCCGARAAY